MFFFKEKIFTTVSNLIVNLGERASEEKTDLVAGFSVAGFSVSGATVSGSSVSNSSVDDSSVCG